MTRINSHFECRALDRIGAIDPNALYADLKLALSNPDRWQGYIERVINVRKDVTIWRFRIECGIFYVLEKKRHPVTILTQDMVRGYKDKVRRKW